MDFTMMWIENNMIPLDKELFKFLVTNCIYFKLQKRNFFNFLRSFPMFKWKLLKITNMLDILYFIPYKNCKTIIIWYVFKSLVRLYYLFCTNLTNYNKITKVNLVKYVLTVVFILLNN